jgi:hypothetical protein
MKIQAKYREKRETQTQIGRKYPLTLGPTGIKKHIKSSGQGDKLT